MMNHTIVYKKKNYLCCLLVLLCMAVLFPGRNAESAQVVDRIVAVVNDDIIRLVELNKAAARYEEQIRSKGYPPYRETEEIYKIRTDVLNNLIDDKLADQEIKDSGIFVDDREVDAAIEQVKAMNYYSDEDLRAALTASGINMDEYRTEIKKQILRNNLVNIKIKSKIIITDTDIAAYYEKHPDKYAVKQKYMLRNIMMPYPIGGDKQSREAVYSRMESVYKELSEGASFQEMAKKYSEAINAGDGGKLGLFALDELTENIQAAVKELKAGEFSSITETEQGYQLFYVEKIEETAGRPLSEVTDEIRKMLYEEEVNKKFQSWIENLREEANIQIIR